MKRNLEMNAFNFSPIKIAEIQDLYDNGHRFDALREIRRHTGGICLANAKEILTHMLVR